MSLRDPHCTNLDRRCLMWKFTWEKDVGERKVNNAVS